jgi:hypothetical protein
MICDECGLPFNGRNKHPFTGDDAAMRRWILGQLTDRRITEAPTLEAAIAAAHDLHGVTAHGGSAPHRPYFHCRPNGVEYFADVLPRQRECWMTWREVCLALRSGAEQLSLFGGAS